MARRARYTKIAVDQGTKDYWASYFGPYGKQWTADVPRRVAAALLTRTASASKTATARSPRCLKAQVAPLGWTKTATGGLLFEGVFRGRYASAAKQTTVIETFCAEFDSAGKLLKLDRFAA